MERSLLVPVITGDIAMVEACLEMNNIAAENHRSSYRQPYEQRLVPWRVSRSGEQHEGSISKDVVVAVDELYRMLLVESEECSFLSGALVALSYSTL